MKLYFAAFKGISVSSKIIKHQTGGLFSHIAIFLDGHAKEMCEKRGYPVNDKCFIEQWPHGDNFFDAWFDFSNLAEHTPGTQYEIWSLDLPWEQWQYCMEYYLNHLKEPYDWAGIAHFRIKMIKEDPNKSFCSEIAIEPILRVRRIQHLSSHNIHPSGLIGLVEFAGGKLEEARMV